MPDDNLTDYIESISPKAKAKVVAVRLCEYFTNKSFKPGDALPTEWDKAGHASLSGSASLAFSKIQHFLIDRAFSIIRMGIP